MTTNAFTTAARAKAEGTYSTRIYPGSASTWDQAIQRAAFTEGAEWARDHLARQEVTDAEVREVKIALIQDEYRVVPGNELVMIRQMGREGEYDHRARAALAAAKEARHG